jgi:hypothetical protein
VDQLEDKAERASISYVFNDPGTTNNPEISLPIKGMTWYTSVKNSFVLLGRRLGAAVAPD